MFTHKGTILPTDNKKTNAAGFNLACKLTNIHQLSVNPIVLPNQELFLVEGVDSEDKELDFAFVVALVGLQVAEGVGVEGEVADLETHLMEGLLEVEHSEILLPAH